MTCNFCGSTLDDNELECPYCGHRTEVQPVQESEFDYGYDDQPVKTQRSQRFASEESYDDDYEEEEVLEEKPVKSSKSPKASFSSFKGNNKVNSLGNFPAILFSALSALLALFCLISLVGTKKKLSDMEQTVLSQFYQMQSTTQSMSQSIAALSGDISSVGTAINEANDSRNITITRSPLSDATYLGRGSDEDVSQNSPLFYAGCNGSIQKIEWQIKENGEWVPIAWDEGSNNLTYGLHIFNSIASSTAESQLCSHNITAQALNKQYRCVFYDAYGSKATEVATLSEKAA